MRRLLGLVLLTATLFVAPGLARATEYTGMDLGGADLVLADGDTLTGVFTNVGKLTIPGGAVVHVVPGAPLEIHASTIEIAGTLDGTGAGGPGGGPNFNYWEWAGSGSGPGGGGGGQMELSCYHPTGGGGGGYGGAGGRGGRGHSFGVGGVGGSAYGVADALTDHPMGSGGGAGAITCENRGGGAGGRGGASIVLDARTQTISGTVRADGADGGWGTYVAHWNGPAGGGGGSGGTVVFTGGTITVTGAVSARGGAGGHPNGGNLAAYSGGGGGGGGGRVKVFASSLAAFTPDVSGGGGAPNGAIGSDRIPSADGAAGTTHITVPTTTTVSSLTTPSVFHQPVTFLAHVTGEAAGTVDFRAGGLVIGSGTLNAVGDATFTTSALAVGNHTIDAAYLSDGIHGTSVATSFTQTVAQAGSVTAVTSSQNPSIIHGDVTLEAKVTAAAPSTGTPSGSVSFYAAATPLGASALDGDGIARLTARFSLGSHTVTAVYAGTHAYTGSTSPPLTQLVEKDGTTLAVVSSENPSVFGGAVTFTATATTDSTGGTPTGTITFEDGDVTLGSVELDEDGVATYTTSALGGGTHPIIATYGGDAAHAGGARATLHQVVETAETSVAVTSSVTPSVFGQATTLSATVSSAVAADRTGSVTFFDDAVMLGTGTVANDVATFTTGALGVGSHVIVAVYSGDANFSGGTGTVTHRVDKASTSTALVASSSPSLVGASVTFSANVTASAPGDGTPTGQVTFKNDEVVLGTATLNGAGLASLATSTLIAGAHSITAIYEGDASLSTSTSPIVTQLVSQHTATTALTSSLNPSTFATKVIFSARVAGPGATPTGTVTFVEGATQLATGTLDAMGSATFESTTLGVGSHTITATYDGNADYASGATGNVIQVVSKAKTTTAVASSKNPSATGQDVTFTATVTAKASLPAGSVEFFDAKVSLGKVTLNGSGTTATATIATSKLTAGGHAISAVYAGDTSHDTSTSAAFTQNVDPPVATKPDAGADAGGVDAGGVDTGNTPLDGEAGGGCSCRTTPASDGNALLGLPLVGAALLLARRRRGPHHVASAR